MNLDERLRSELRAIEVGELREDDALDQIRSTNHRGLVRARVARQATTLVVVLSLFAGVAVFVSWRNVAVRYRSAATVRVAMKPAPNATTSGPAAVKLADPRKIALAASTRRAALRRSHLSPGGTRIDFRVTSAGSGLITLAATAPTARESATVTRNWFSELVHARRVDARRRIVAANRALNRKATALHNRLMAVDIELVKADPVNYRGVLEYDAPHGVDADGPPPIPENGSAHALDLANERIRILAELQALASQPARIRITSVTPAVVTALIDQTPAVRVDETPPATAPAFAGWLAAVVFVLAGALIVYRRRARRLGQVSA